MNKKKENYCSNNHYYIVTMLYSIKYTYKDGGTVSYKAILYSYTKYHKLQENDAYYDATEFLLFPFNFLS